MRKVDMAGAVHWAVGEGIATTVTLCGLRPRHWNAASPEDDAEVTCERCAEAVPADHPGRGAG